MTALGGGAMVPVGMAIIGDIYPPERRPSALGILGAIDTAGLGLGTALWGVAGSFSRLALAVLSEHSLEFDCNCGCLVGVE